MTIIERNRERDLYLREMDGSEPTGNVVMIPREWCDEFTCENGFTGGPDFDAEAFPNVVADGPEVYCYSPMSREANADVDTQFYSLADLETYPELTEAEARVIHPRMFEIFDEINNE